MSPTDPINTRLGRLETEIRELRARADRAPVRHAAGGSGGSGDGLPPGGLPYQVLMVANDGRQNGLNWDWPRAVTPPIAG